MLALFDQLGRYKTYDSETHHEGPETRRWVRFHRLLLHGQYCFNQLCPPPARQLTQSPISCSRFSAMKASVMSSGSTRTSSWSAFALPPNSSLCSDSLLFFVAMMGNGGSEESSSPKKCVGGDSERKVFEDPQPFHEGIHQTLYPLLHGLRVSRLHSMTMGTPPRAETTRRVGGAGLITVQVQAQADTDTTTEQPA
jgi:hypothetical protein